MVNDGNNTINSTKALTAITLVIIQQCLMKKSQSSYKPSLGLELGVVVMFNPSLLDLYGEVQRRYVTAGLTWKTNRPARSTHQVRKTNEKNINTSMLFTVSCNIITGRDAALKLCVVLILSIIRCNVVIKLFLACYEVDFEEFSSICYHAMLAKLLNKM